MFMYSVTQPDTQFTSPAGNAIFDRISGRTFRGDYSFIATLRAFLSNRLPEGKTFSMWVNDSPVNIESSGNYLDDEHLMTRVIGHVPDHEIAIVNLRQAGERADNTMQNLSDKFKDSNFEYVAKLSSHIESTKLVSHCRIFCNKEKCAVLIFLNTMDTRTWHALQCLIPPLLPALFEGKPVTPEEFEVIRGLNSETEEAYLNAIRVLEKSIDFRGYQIKSVCGGLMKRVADVHINALNEDISHIRRRMSDLMASYREQCLMLDQRNLDLSAYILRRNAGGNDEELIEFLNHQTWFNPVEAKPEGFSFIVTTPIEFWDPDMFESIANNEDSFYWDDVSVSDCFDDEEDRMMLLKAIFGPDPIMKVRFVAYYNLDTRGTIGTVSGYSFAPEYKDYMPNPHLYHFSCFGQHLELIQDRIQAGDLIGAVMQCKTSAASLNVGESPTMTHFLEELFCTNKKCIELLDGRFVSPEDALLYLKGELNNA